MSSEKVWLITGASTGLGLELARRALARGDRVIATARTLARFADLSTSLSAEALSRLQLLRLDVTAPINQLEEVAAEAVKVWERVDVLVNNAGVVGKMGASEELGAEGILEVMRTNFFGAVNVTNAFLPHMREKREGTVVLLGSRSAFRNEVLGLSAYSASKAALHSYGETLSAELNPFNIRVLILAPAAVGYAQMPQPTPKHIQDYDPARQLLEDMLEKMKNSKGDDPRSAMDVVVDVVRGEGQAAERPRPLWLFLGAQAFVDVAARLKRMGTVLEDWREIGGKLGPIKEDSPR
ncbi:NAD-P-binding protein [Artomyces pyxidatus]|uniref:NAD-P-binding protein n=1 Tax=Artomyces pyxidatus TaxID=48021 RepID=A0ACB8SIS2_9AGAM|nr:NAD-P-binding protein [Artomyces pyxidatus]